MGKRVKTYFWKKKDLLLGAAVFWLLFGLVFYLCDLNPKPFVYAVCLTAFLLLTGLATGFFLYLRHMQKLEGMAKLAEEGLGSDLPADSAEEKLYAGALLAVQKKKEEAQEILQRELEDARRYYALWSHQIKTPLAALKLLVREEEPDRRAMELELLQAGQYVEMALQYQRMAGGTGDLVLQEYSLEKLVKQAVKKTAPLFIYKKLGLEIGEMAGTVVTDEKWLVFVLEQVLTNAVKYTRKGTVRIRQEGETLVVEDTGMGILPEDLPRVFEWGYTGFNGREDKHSTGIGLCLCRQMMGRLDHGIRLESAPGVGTKVYLDLAREQFAIE